MAIKMVLGEAVVELNRSEIREWVEAQLEHEGLPPEDTINHLAMCLEHIVLWYNDNYPVGRFLSAVLRNDLMGAIGRADDVNLKYLRIYTLFLYNELPANYTAKASKGLGLED